MASLWALATAIAYAIVDVIIGLASRRSHPLVVSIFVSVGGTLFFLFAALFGSDFRIEAISLLYGSLIGILFAVANVSFYKALSMGPMGTVSVTCSLSPLVPLVFDILVGKAPSQMQYVGFLLITSGIWLVVMMPKTQASTALSGANACLLAIPAALIFGVNDVLFELADTASMLGLLFIIQASKLLTSIMIAVPVRNQLRIGWMQGMKLLPLGAIYGIGWIALYWSAKQGSIDITSALEYSSPVFVAILTYFFLKERLSRQQLTGFFVALAGVVFLVSFPVKQHAAGNPCQSTPRSHPNPRAAPRLSGGSSGIS